MAGDVSRNDGYLQAICSEITNDKNNNGSKTTRTNPFAVLPPEMLANILSYMDPRRRQQLRIINRFWKFVVDTYFGICLHVNNINWNSVENCSYATSIILNGFSRDVLNPEIITYSLKKLEITDFVAYYSLMPLLEECYTLESLVINCVTFLQKSRLTEYTSSDYLERNGKDCWLPRLKHFKFISCTTQGGVYNHSAPIELQDEIYGIEDMSRASYDISRGEMEFLPFILQILGNAKSLAHVEMMLTDIWKIPFTDLLQVNVDSPTPSLDISLWHFGSKRLLPIGNLLHKVNSMRTMKFNFPYHFDTFFMKFKPISTKQLEKKEPFQLEEVSVHQSFRWSQEMSQVDIPWLQILEKQHVLTVLEYPFPVYGNDDRVANIITQNSSTLRRVVFTGHREERELLEDFRGSRLQSWNAEWFASCMALEALSLKSNSRFLLTPANISTVNNVNLLPRCLKHFTFHGCVDTGNYPLSSIFFKLVNLESFTHQARLCPWFKVAGASINQLQFNHAMDIISSLPKLKRWTLEWCDTSAVMTNAAINPQVQRQSAYVSKQLLDWMESMKDSLAFAETTIDRQLKSLRVNIFSHLPLNQSLN